MLNALFFDLDGTLVDTHGLIVQCCAHAIRVHLDQPMRREIWEKHVGLPLDVVLMETWAYYGQTLAPDHLDAVKRTYREHMHEHAHGVRAFPGIVEMLTALRGAGTRLAIVTTKYRPMAERHLQTSGLETFFEVMVTGDQCEKLKPDTEPFVRALAAMNLAPANAAHVGDSQHDIVGARAAGLFAIAATWGTDNLAVLLATRPDAMFHSPSALFQALITLEMLATPR